MIVVKPSFEEIDSEDLYRKVERCGRVCYKSENLITEESAKIFVKKILNNHHGAVLEHFSFAFKVDEKLYKALEREHYPFITLSNISFPLVSFNLRTIVDHYQKEKNNVTLAPFYGYLEKRYPDIFCSSQGDRSEEVYCLSKDELMNLKAEERDKHLKVTIKVITDRGISHELVRHRLCSFAQESTRYCNYAKDKFSSQITVVCPISINDDEKKYALFEKAMQEAEKSYFDLLEASQSPQVARSVLPTALKTELVMTATVEEWRLIFDLRTAAAAHPDCRYLMEMVKEYFLRKGYIS